jgi:hypothetical protein
MLVACCYCCNAHTCSQGQCDHSGAGCHCSASCAQHVSKLFGSMYRAEVSTVRVSQNRHRLAHLQLKLQVSCSALPRPKARTGSSDPQRSVSCRASMNWQDALLQASHQHAHPTAHPASHPTSHPTSHPSSHTCSRSPCSALTSLNSAFLAPNAEPIPSCPSMLDPAAHTSPLPAAAASSSSIQSSSSSSSSSKASQDAWW